MRAILLAGGQGTRLRPLTLHTPKPVVPIFDRPFLQYQIDLVRRVPEIDEVVLSLNYQPHRIQEVLGDGSALGIRLRYVVEPMPLGTGGAIRYAAGDDLAEPVVVFNGDVFTSVDLAAVIAQHRARRATATIVLTPVDNPLAYGLVESDADQRVRAFVEKPTPEQVRCNTINAGIYVLEPEPLLRIPRGEAFSIERRYFPSLVDEDRTFLAHVSNGYWIDIGTPAKYRDAHRDIMDGRFVAPPFAHEAGASVIAPTARVADTAAIAAPSFIGAGSIVGAGATIGPHSVIGEDCRVGEHAVVNGAILWPGTTVGAHARVGAALVGRRCRIGDYAEVQSTAILGDDTVVTDYSTC